MMNNEPGIRSGEVSAELTDPFGIILFDGVCNLCNRMVDFIIRKDKKDYFRFAALQSDAGKSLLEKFNLPFRENESVILIEHGKVYRKSDATCRIMKRLSAILKVLSWSIILPKPLRDSTYDFIAHHRYHWFGRRDTCRLPSPEEAKKFLD